MFLGPPWKPKPQYPGELLRCDVWTATLCFLHLLGWNEAALSKSAKENMKMWKEDLEEQMDMGEHWPIERGPLPSGKCLEQPPAASIGKGMVTNFVRLA